jgi:hypothetical protein
VILTCMGELIKVEVIAASTPFFLAEQEKAVKLS